ncbi:hypothetical protein OF83DRAFT_345052 [Amylostereum chailletii]|nr:hypothetical protein OF83DRAFT_345052 [Amylostereum chailletii]
MQPNRVSTFVMSFLKIVFLCLVGVAYRSCLTPPNPPASPDERMRAKPSGAGSTLVERVAIYSSSLYV